MSHTATPPPVASAADVPAAARRTVPVAFSVPADFGGGHAELLGEFLSWSPVPMDRRADGGFEVVLHLETGRRWRYRFMIDGDRLVNDPLAHDFVPCHDGGHVSVIAT